MRRIASSPHAAPDCTVAVVTSESRANLRVCGFGSGGRLGPGQHTQYSLVPLAQFTGSVTSVALGQDHTLLVTRSGEVYSWGLNRFSQLGYVVEVTDGAKGRVEEPIQATARKVVGPLKNKTVIGVAACKTASACWTASEVYTWGTNSGQLGRYTPAILPHIPTLRSQATTRLHILFKYSRVLSPKSRSPSSRSLSLYAYQFFHFNFVSHPAGHCNGLSFANARRHLPLERRALQSELSRAGVPVGDCGVPAAALDQQREHREDHELRGHVRCTVKQRRVVHIHGPVRRGLRCEFKWETTGGDRPAAGVGPAQEVHISEGTLCAAHREASVY